MTNRAEISFRMEETIIYLYSLQIMEQITAQATGEQKHKRFKMLFNETLFQVVIKSFDFFLTGRGRLFLL